MDTQSYDANGSPVEASPTTPAVAPKLDIAELIQTARNSHSPLERECAVRAAYLMGGVHALDGKANATYDRLVSA